MIDTCNEELVLPWRWEGGAGCRSEWVADWNRDYLHVAYLLVFYSFFFESGHNIKKKIKVS